MKVDLNSRWQGVWTAIATPFNQDGKISWEAFAKLLDSQAKAAVKGVVVAGTTGESPTLSDAEKLEMIAFARKSLPPSVSVMAGTGSSDTAMSLALSKKAADAGADALLIVTPPYNKPSLAGLKAHFQAITSVGLPVCLYHVPGRTAHKLSAAALTELASLPGVDAVKEASADLILYSEGVQARNAAYLSGDDFTYLPSLSVGGAGVISVVSNVYPAEMVALSNAYWAGDYLKALAIHDALFPAMTALFCESNPSPLKAALAIKGFCLNQLRLPLASVTEQSQRLIEEALAKTDKALAELK